MYGLNEGNPGDGPHQLENAKTVARTVRGDGYPWRALKLCYQCIYQESRFLVYANEGNAESLALAHDAVGSDHDSVGLYQQRTPMWGTTADCMDPATSTRKFLIRLAGAVALSGGWDGDQVDGHLVQIVQGSALPDAYDQHSGNAAALANAMWDGATQDAHVEPTEDRMPTIVKNKDRTMLRLLVDGAVVRVLSNEQADGYIALGYPSGELGEREFMGFHKSAKNL